MGKVFTFEKPKTKLKPISFRPTQKHYDILQTLFQRFNVESKKNRISDLMLGLIERMDSIVKEWTQLQKANEELTKQNNKLSSQIKMLETQLENAKAELQKTKMKPIRPQPRKPIPEATSQPTKSEAVRPTQVVENVPIPEKPKELEKPKVERPTYESIIQKLINEGKCLRGLDLKEETHREIACHWCFNNFRTYYDRCRATVKVQVAEKTI